MTRYANVYEHCRPGRCFQFTDHWLGHETRDAAEAAAAWEQSVEPNTRRIGLVRMIPKG
jgi:hypothetical protein